MMDWLCWWRKEPELKRLEERAMIAIEDARAALNDAAKRDQKAIQSGQH
jgi:hypothetical protein